MLTATVRKVIFDFETVDMVNFEWNQELFEAAKFEEGLEQGLRKTATRSEGYDPQYAAREDAARNDCKSLESLA